MVRVDPLQNSQQSWRAALPLARLGTRGLARIFLASSQAKGVDQRVRQLSVACLLLDLTVARRTSASAANRINQPTRTGLAALESALWAAAIPENHGVTAALNALDLTEMAIADPRRAVRAASLHIAAALAMRKAFGRKFEIYPYLMTAASLAGGVALRRNELWRARSTARDVEAAEVAVRTAARENGRFDAITAPVRQGAELRELLDVIGQRRSIFLGHPRLDPQVADLLFGSTKLETIPPGSLTLPYAIRRAIDAYNDATISLRHKILCTPSIDPALDFWWVTEPQVVALAIQVRRFASVRDFHVTPHTFDGVGRPLSFLINGHMTSLPADPEYQPDPLTQPIPSVPAVGMIWALMEATPIGADVPIRYALVAMVGFGIVAIRADRLFRRDGQRSHAQIFSESTVASALQYAVVKVALRRHPTERYTTPFQTSTLVPSTLAGVLSGRSALPFAKITLALTAGSFVRSAWRADPMARSAPWLANFGTFFGGRRYARTLHALDSDQLARAVRSLKESAADDHAQVFTATSIRLDEGLLHLVHLIDEPTVGTTISEELSESERQMIRDEFRVLRESIHTRLNEQRTR